MVFISVAIEVIREIPTAPADHFPHGSWGEIGQLRGKVLGAEKNKNLLRRPKNTAIKCINKKRVLLGEATDHEMPRQADRLQIQADPLGDEEINRAERNRDTSAAFEHLIDETVIRVGVVFDVSTESHLMIENTVDDSAFGPGGRRLDNELTTTARDTLQFFATGTRIEFGTHRAGNEQRAGFELVVQRSNKTAKIRTRVREVKLVEILSSVPSEVAIGAASCFPQEVSRGQSQVGEVMVKSSPDRGTGIVDQTQQSGLFRGC